MAGGTGDVTMAARCSWANEVDNQQRKPTLSHVETPTKLLEASRSGPCQDLLLAGAEVCSAACSGRSLVGKMAHWFCSSPTQGSHPHLDTQLCHTDATQCQDTETHTERDHSLA